MNLTTSTRQSARQNHLLAALPAAEFATLLPQLELVPMPLGLIIYESGDAQGYVYFPTTSIVSLIRMLADGLAAGGAIVGNEGALGVASFMGGESTPDRAVVLSAGYAYRIRSSALKSEFRRSGELRKKLLRFMLALIAQATQTAVCNRHHSVEQQLCRFVLSLLDRLPSQELTMTQELIANTLGVRREGVTVAAGRLQAAGMIRYRRGHISVIDRSKLQARSCECYAVVQREYDRLLPEYPLAETAPILQPPARLHHQAVS